MNRILAVGAIALAVLPAKGNAAAPNYYTSGTFLLEGCQGWVATQTDWHAGYCAGVVDGVTSAVLGLHIACIPERATEGQIVRVVLKYLQDHPQDLHMDGSVLAMEAIKQAWPCPTKKKP